MEGEGSVLLLTAVAGCGLVVTIAAGFLISSMAVLGLMNWFPALDGRPYEANLSVYAYRRIPGTLESAGTCGERQPTRGGERLARQLTKMLQKLCWSGQGEDDEAI